MIWFNFDVLATPHEEIGSRQPRRVGFNLWRYIADGTQSNVSVTYRGRLTGTERALLDTWMRRENIKPTVFHELEDDLQLAVTKVHELSTLYGAADLYIDTDVRMCTELLKRGVPTLCLSDPVIVRPEWYEATVIRPWDELAAEKDRQAELRHSS